jgi:hypothetical protein
VQTRRWKRKLLTYHRRVFSVRDATRFPCRLDLDEGDRVEIRLIGTVRDFSQHLALDGYRELNVHIQAYSGAVVKVLDKEKPKRRATKKRSPAPTAT